MGDVVAHGDDAMWSQRGHIASRSGPCMHDYLMRLRAPYSINRKGLACVDCPQGARHVYLGAWCVCGRGHFMLVLCGGRHLHHVLFTLLMLFRPSSWLPVGGELRLQVDVLGDIVAVSARHSVCFDTHTLPHRIDMRGLIDQVIINIAHTMVITPAHLPGHTVAISHLTELILTPH